MGLFAVLNEGNVFFRAPVVMCLVWFLWGINVWVFRRVNIDYATALELDKQTTLSPRAICSSALLCFGIVALLWFFHKLHWPYRDELVLPSAMYISALVVLFLPFNILHLKGRRRLVQNLYRVFVPSPQGIKFVEVVLGDILTSLSKTLADLQISICIILSHILSSEETVTIGDNQVYDVHSVLKEGCSQSWLRPFVTALPFLLRFRQCIVAYRATGLWFPHLVNAAKYASALPVILISTIAHNFPSSYGLHMHKLWLVSITFNSFFSFLWDVVMDFGLFKQDTTYLFLRQRLMYVDSAHKQYRKVRLSADQVLRAKDSSQDLFEDEEDTEDDKVEPSTHPTTDEVPANPGGTTKVNSVVDMATKMLSGTLNGGVSNRFSSSEGSGSPEAASKDDTAILDILPSRILTQYRPQLPSTPVIYYGAIILDFLLRVLWSFKLSVHLHLTQEGLTFVLEICEVLRRFLWLFLRVEWQVVETEDEVPGSATSDVEMADAGFFPDRPKQNLRSRLPSSNVSSS